MPIFISPINSMEIYTIYPWICYLYLFCVWRPRILLETILICTFACRYELVLIRFVAYYQSLLYDVNNVYEPEALLFDSIATVTQMAHNIKYISHICIVLFCCTPAAQSKAKQKWRKKQNKNVGMHKLVIIETHLMTACIWRIYFNSEIDRNGR